MDDNWVWVDGFKTTNANMQGYGGFQYELNKLYHQDGEIKICNNGFHFCLKLGDVFEHASEADLLKARFFKCKGLVRAEDVENYGKLTSDLLSYGSYYPLPPHVLNKIVAKEILLTEEITDTELVTKGIMVRKDNLLFLRELDCRPHSQEEYNTKAWELVMNTLSKYGYSKTFITIMAMIENDTPSYIMYLKAKAYGEEGLSPDMRAYLLSKDLQK